MTNTEMAIRLASAAICGAVIGFEREQQQKPAGLRTHMLVSIGSAAFTMSALSIDSIGIPQQASQNMAVDPSRVIQGIAGGIGFLGAGAIIRSGGAVFGLTTAATIWVVGAVGIGCGLGNYTLAVMTCVLAVLIASSLGMITGWLFPHKPDPNSDDSKGPTAGKLSESETGTDPKQEPEGDDYFSPKS